MTPLPSRFRRLFIGVSPTFQILSRYGIVLRELPGSTHPIGLRTEELFISYSTLGYRGSLLFEDHRLSSIVTDYGLLIL